MEFPGIINQDGEEWKTIPHFENYKCSNYGRVISMTYGRWGGVGEISQTIDRYGYWRLCLYKDGKQYNFTTHKLVAELFIGPRPEHKQVDHIDTNKLNCRFDNLEYVTRSENIKRAYQNGLIHTVTDFSDEQILQIFKFKREGFRNNEIAQTFEVAPSTIGRILKGVTHKRTLENLFLN